MKKLIIALLALLCLTGCGAGEENVDVGKTGMICLPNGEVIEGEIESLTRWTAANVEVSIDGVTYCVHPAMFAVIEEG